MKRSKANQLLRNIAWAFDAYIGKEKTAFDSHSWANVAFTLALGIEHYHHRRIRDFKPAGNNATAHLQEELSSTGMGPYMRPILRRTKPEVLEAACWLAFRYYKAANGESHT